MKFACGCAVLLFANEISSAQSSASCSSAEPQKTVQRHALLQRANTHDEQARSLHPNAPRVALVSAERGVDFGGPKCPCIGIDAITGSTTVQLGEGVNTSYPADVGAHCDAWDKGRHPACKATSGAGPAWCKEKWCFVDPCSCDIPVMPKLSLYLEDSRFQGKSIYYSYATCGGVDEWTAENKADACVNQKTEDACLGVDACSWSEDEMKCGGKEAMGACDAVTITPDVGGSEGCQCVGISNQSGSTDLVLNGLKIAYPADVGASCSAWDKMYHPKCGDDPPPEWCLQEWCWVDPCKCDLVKTTPPKVSQGLKDASIQGKPVYYSYATCGSEDSWTATMAAEACVNQKSEAECSTKPKCAWSKDNVCLGKELVEACASPIDEAASSDSTTSASAPATPAPKTQDEASTPSGGDSTGGPGEPWVPPAGFKDPEGKVKIAKSGCTAASLSFLLAAFVVLVSNH